MTFRKAEIYCFTQGTRAFVIMWPKQQLFTLVWFPFVEIPMQRKPQALMITWSLGQTKNIRSYELDLIIWHLVSYLRSVVKNPGIMEDIILCLKQRQWEWGILNNSTEWRYQLWICCGDHKTKWSGTHHDNDRLYHRTSYISR